MEYREKEKELKDLENAESREETERSTAPHGPAGIASRTKAALMAVGGIAYTIGGVIYIAKRPNISCTLGFHELFHLFVLAGSAAHYIMVFWFVL